MAEYKGGGRLRPPLLHAQVWRRLSRVTRRGLLLAAGAWACAASAVPAPAQRAFPKLPARRQEAALPAAREALALLRRMMRPAADFAGEQVTEITARGGHTSRLRVKGDRKGRLRCEFTAPESLADDVMLIAPDSFRHYHARARTLDVALWPTEWSSRDRRMMRLIAERLLNVERVGEETVAGRAAAIVQVSPRRAGPAGFSAKFWVDRETGIKLKHEISNATGLVSRSYMTAVTVGPGAGVTPKDFMPLFPGARVRTLFPPHAQFESVAAAGDRLPFRPVEPSSLPPNFRLSGVWVTGDDLPKRGPARAVLLRYTNGVGDFALFQRKFPPGAGDAPGRRERGGRGFVQTWRVSQPDGPVEVVFLGHLPAGQVEAVRDSLGSRQ